MTGPAFLDPKNPLLNFNDHKKFSIGMLLRAGRVFSRSRLFSSYGLEKTLRMFFDVIEEELETRESRKEGSLKDLEIKARITYLTYKIEMVYVVFTNM
ncbi:hypothetical protein AUJ77_00400 [Candidatus Nomurabacteria bacterium CG1_02_43_90]|uniref:Uncharacterized protein n=1 Tax=Candidatus Nomurabacteria bacterium CG1_02_43_90 TaxID=1805281 RepID=A0A1J4V7I8_9BACT|nr:MAG: hypothetical protein AUJ77_00400 [Candidatus Nomurabacteria bacterium CG1_02_43_90]